jgi:hypothetical protein
MTNAMDNTVTLVVSQGELQIHKEELKSPAEAVVRSRQYQHPAKKVIRLAGGDYFLENPLVLDARDRGLSIESEDGARPVLYGGRLVTGWTPDGPQFWAADVPQVRSGQWDFRMLVVNGRFCERARLPESGFFKNRSKWDVPWMSTTGGGWKRKPTPEELRSMVYDPKDLGPGLDMKNAEFTVYHMWDESSVGVAAIDTATHTVTFSNPSGHPPGAFGVHKYVVRNVREGMTKPGQWYLDRQRGKIVYWPLPNENINDSKVIAPTMESIIRIDGTKDAPVGSVALRGLTLSVSNTPLKSGGFGAGRFKGAVHVMFAHNSELSDLTIVNVGGQGIKEYGSQNLRINRCHIHHTGACGLKFEQGDKLIEDNHVHDVGITYPSAIALWGGGRDGAGSLIWHNDIHHVPYTAIACVGSGHRIESNLIHHAMQELHDGAGIYITFCEGITVRGNFIRDIVDTGGYGASAYYLDEGAEDCLVEGNVAFRVARPSHNHMAKNNTIRNNFFLHDGDMTLTFPKSSGYVFATNILQVKGKITFNNANAIAKMEKNVIFSESQSVAGVAEDNALEDPQLRHDGSGKVTFAADSAATQLGIEMIDVSGAGVRRGGQ